MSRVQAEEIVDRIVAVVNNDIITYLELQRELKPFEEKIKAMDYQEEKEHQMIYKVRKDMLSRLIDEKLTDQEIEQKNITVSEAEIDESIERLKASRMWTDEELRKALAAEGMTIEEYRHSLRNQTLRGRLIGREIKSKIVITKEDVRAYYDKHIDQYRGELKYHLRNIIMSVSSSADEDAGMDIRKRMESVLEKLNTGESFEALAREYSESSLADKGGDLGKIRYEDFSSQIQQALKGLEPGDYTSILDTEQGFQIFFVEDIVMEGGKSFEEVSPEIEELLYNEFVDKKYAEWLEELTKRSHIKIIQ